MLGFQGGVSIPLVKGGVKAPPAKRQCRAGPKAGARRGFTCSRIFSTLSRFSTTDASTIQKPTIQRQDGFNVGSCELSAGNERRVIFRHLHWVCRAGLVN